MGDSAENYLCAHNQIVELVRIGFAGNPVVSDGLHHLDWRFHSYHPELEVVAVTPA